VVEDVDLVKIFERVLEQNFNCLPDGAVEDITNE